MARPNVRTPTGLRNRAILAMLHRAGLRASEACGLHLRDVNVREATVRIRAEVGKGGHEAVLPFDPETVTWLERWIAVRRQYAARRPHLFTTLKGGPLARQYVWEMVSRYARRAGIERPVWPHLLRHTFATELLGEGFNLEEVRRLMRHRDISTTGIYLHVRDAELAEKVRARG